MNTSIAVIQPRLQMPANASGIDAGVWRVLCESIFPSARSADAIVMAWDYCRARKLDILKKPVHIVPMWSASLKKEVETVWPSITEVQTTASRTGQYAGMDEPKFGKMIDKKFEGINYEGKQVSAQVSFPEWCSITVYRLVGGQRCAFTEPVYWLEAYGRLSKTNVPNDQWSKRPMGMITKVAKAFSLRAAFPEEGFHTAEEMEGHILEETDANGVIIDNTEPLKVKSVFKNSTLRNTYCKNVMDYIERATTKKELNQYISLEKQRFDEMRFNANDHDVMAVDEIQKRYQMKIAEIEEAEEYLNANTDETIGGLKAKV